MTILSHRPQVLEVPLAPPPQAVSFGPYLVGAAHRLGRLVLMLAGVAV